MSTQLVDPFATPEPIVYRASTYDMCDAITYRVRDSRYNDPELLPQLVQRTLLKLRQGADDGTPEVAVFARRLLEDLWHRAESGVPYGEPEEPPWSLDAERQLPLIRKVETVVEDL